MCVLHESELSFILIVGDSRKVYYFFLFKMQSQSNQSSLTFESDPQALLGVYKLVPSLPTFLAQALHSTSGNIPLNFNQNFRQLYRFKRKTVTQ